MNLYYRVLIHPTRSFQTPLNSFEGTFGCLPQSGLSLNNFFWWLKIHVPKSFFLLGKRKNHMKLNWQISWMWDNFPIPRIKKLENFTFAMNALKIQVRSLLAKCWLKCFPQDPEIIWTVHSCVWRSNPRQNHTGNVENDEVYDFQASLLAFSSLCFPSSSHLVNCRLFRIPTRVPITCDDAKQKTFAFFS